MPLKMTTSEVPMSAATAIQSVASPSAARRTKAALVTRDKPDVGPDDPQGPPAQGDSEGELLQVVAHQSDVGRLDRRVGARRPHGDTHGGRG